MRRALSDRITAVSACICVSLSVGAAPSLHLPPSLSRRVCVSVFLTEWYKATWTCCQMERWKWKRRRNDCVPLAALHMKSLRTVLCQAPRLVLYLIVDPLLISLRPYPTSIMSATRLMGRSALTSRTLRDFNSVECSFVGVFFSDNTTLITTTEAAIRHNVIKCICSSRLSLSAICQIKEIRNFKCITLSK